MGSETLNTQHNAPTPDNGAEPNAWNSLTGYEFIDQQLQDDLANIDDMLESGRIDEAKADKYRAEVSARAQEHADVQRHLAQMEQSEQSEQNESQDDNATPVHDWALHPIKKGESSREFGDRKIKQGDMIVLSEYVPRAENETAKEYSQHVASIRERFPRDPGETLDQYRSRIEELSQEGTLLETPKPEARRQEQYIDDASYARAVAARRRGKHARAPRPGEVEEQLDDDALRAKPENAKHIKWWHTDDALRSRLEDAERAKLEAAERTRQELEAREHMEQGEQTRFTREQYEAKLKELSDIAHEKAVFSRSEYEAKIRELEEVAKEKQALEAATPLVAINADFTHDKAELAHHYAKEELDAETAKAGFFKRLWKGTLFNKYFQKKYEKEIISGERQFTANGELVDIDDIIADRSDSAIERFVLGATEEYHDMVHTKAGESLTEADSRTTEAVKDAIEWFATAPIPEDGSIKDLTIEFGNRIRRLQAENRDQGQPLDETFVNNYYEVAVQARERAEHGMAMDRVMEGFKVYNADVRSNVRTQEHRDNLDKIIDRLESSKFGQFIPAEVIAAAAGTALSFTRAGAWAIGGPIAAFGLSGAVSGLRERNRLIEDRARMMRNIAIGKEFGGTLIPEEGKGPFAKKLARHRAKYEARLGGTLYDDCPATLLTYDLNDAIELGDPDFLLESIAEARVRVDFSDSEAKDLVSYSSDERMGDERMMLDLALIRAEHSLPEEDYPKLNAMKRVIAERIYADTDEMDAEFGRVKLFESLKSAGKTIAASAITLFTSQELIAAIDPNRIGIFEKFGLLQGEHTEATSETLLASSLGGGRGVDAQVIEGVSGDEEAKIQEYLDAGYTQVEVQPASSVSSHELVDVDPFASDHQTRVIYDGWLDNGTTNIHDGNELALRVGDDAIVFDLSGDSSLDGQTYNYDSLLQDNRIRGYVTVSGAKFEIATTVNSAGQLISPIDANGAVTTTTGESIKVIGDNGEKLYQLIEVAHENGVDPNGDPHILVWATETGDGAFSGTIQQVVDTSIESPAIYDFVKDVPREISLAGVMLPGTAARPGLGATRSSLNATGRLYNRGDEDTV